MDLPPNSSTQVINYEVSIIREIIAIETGLSPHELTDSLSLCDIGMDSLMTLKVLSRIREVSDIRTEIDMAFLVENNTLGEMRKVLSIKRVVGSGDGVYISGRGGEGTRTLALDCWVYNKQPRAEYSSDFEFKVQKIECRDIESNFHRSGSPRNETPIATLQLIIRKQKSSLADPFWDAGVTMGQLNRLIGCPPNLGYLERHDAGVCGRFTTDDKQPVYIHHCSSNNTTISTALRYDPPSNTTIGYIFPGPDISEDSIQKSIHAQFATCPHPLLIPILMSELTAQELMHKLAMIHKDLAIIENRTGYGDWKDSQSGDSEDERDKMGLDFRLMARELGALSSRFAFVEMAIRCALNSTQFTLLELETMHTCLPEDTSKRLDPLSRGLKERLGFLKSNLEHMSLYAGVGMRMQAQQNVLFNLIAQQDNALNIEIVRGSKELAAASKRDSSDMKIIAFLTTIFLPGTFIAAFLAMPFFNWSATIMNDVMNERLWIYWAVTAPLTLVTLGTALIFRGRERRKKRMEMEVAGGGV